MENLFGKKIAIRIPCNFSLHFRKKGNWRKIRNIFESGIENFWENSIHPRVDNELKKKKKNLHFWLYSTNFKLIYRFFFSLQTTGTLGQLFRRSKNHLTGRRKKLLTFSNSIWRINQKILLA